MRNTIYPSEAGWQYQPSNPQHRLNYKWFNSRVDVLYPQKLVRRVIFTTMNPAQQI